MTSSGQETPLLCVACTQSPGKCPNQRRQLRAAKIFVVVKALGEKPKDQLRLESGRTDKKKKRRGFWHSPQSFLLFTLYQDKCKLHLLGYFLVPRGINRRKSSPQISHRSKVLAIRLSDQKFSLRDMTTIRKKRKKMTYL